MSPFSIKVVAVIRKIPRGKVASYGQIAKLAGRPQGSRGVSWILHSCSKKYRLPWHRVINSQGKISFPPQSQAFLRQRKLLRNEGVEVDAWSGRIDLERFGWRGR